MNASYSTEWPSLTSSRPSICTPCIFWTLFDWNSLLSFGHYITWVFIRTKVGFLVVFNLVFFFNLKMLPHPSMPYSIYSTGQKYCSENSYYALGRFFSILIITGLIIISLSPVSNSYKQNSISVFWPLDVHQYPQKGIKSIIRWYCSFESCFVVQKSKRNFAYKSCL